MNLFQNPFFIIGVSTRDSKQSIVDACDAKSLTVDADVCTRSRAALTQPRNRLSAELAWLPGYSPVGAKVLIEKIQKEPTAFLSSLDGMAPLPRCNALATFLEHHKPNTESQITGLLIDVAQSFERIDYSKLMAAINEDRQIAKIPAVQDVESIKQEMQARREYIIGVMKGCLNNTKAPDKVLTKIVETTTSEGTQHPPILVDDLTEKYTQEVKKYLDQLAGQIRNVIERIQEKPKQSFEHQMPTLYKYLKTWDQIAQPIQLVQQSKGLDDPHSKELAQDLRGLALEIANTHDMHSEAKQITKIVAKLFKELPQFAERVAEDLTALDSLLEQKRKSDQVNKIIDPIIQKIKSGESEQALREINSVLYNTTTDPELRNTLKEIKESLEERITKHGKPIDSAPSLHTINGVGTTIYGDTLYFVFLFIPIIPLARYSLESQGGGSYRFFGKLKLHKWQKYWQYALIGLVIFWILK